MQKQESDKILFIVNPVSGGKEKQDWEAAIRDYFRDEKESIDFFILSGKDDRSSIQHHLERVKPAKVVGVGGDGTIRMLAGLLKETSIPLGILPAGSANGMAKELGIPLKVEEALDVIRKGAVRKIDLLRINEEETCIHLSDVGLNAMLVKYFEQSEKRGMWSYGKAIFRVLWQKQKLKVTIQTEQDTLKREAYMVVLANARKYGTGANINPEGDIADGSFEIVIVRKINVLEILKALFTDHSFHPRRIEVISARKAEIRIHRKAHFQVDGEYMNKTDCVQVRIMPGILNLILPEGSA